MARKKAAALPAKAPARTPRPRGRPSKFTPELGQRICKELVEKRSLLRVCAQADIPHFSTVYDWENKGIEEGKVEKTAKSALAQFSRAFARAKKMQAHALMMDCMDIADDGSNDWQETEFGVRLNNEHVSRSKLRVDTRMKLAERLNPEEYAPLQKVGDPQGKALPPATPVTPLIIELTTRKGD